MHDFVRARSPWRALRTLLLLSAVTMLVARAPIPSLRPVLADDYIPVIAMSYMPVIAGLTVATLVDSPWPIAERLSARSLAPWRAGYCGALAGVALVGMLTAAALAPGRPIANTTVLLLGGLGAGLLIAARLPPTAGWLVVPPYALLSLMAGQAGSPFSFLLLVGPQTTLASGVACGFVGALGIGVHVMTRPRSGAVG